MGIQWRGPHDSRLSQILTHNNTGRGLLVEESSTYNGGALEINTIHAYGNGSHGLVFGAAATGTNVQSESNLGQSGGATTGNDGIQVLANNTVLTGLWVWNNPRNGITFGSSSACLGGCYLAGTVYANQTEIDFVNDCGDNNIILNCWQGSSSQYTYSGTYNTGSMVAIVSTGDNAVNVNNIP